MTTGANPKNTKTWLMVLAVALLLFTCCCLLTLLTLTGIIGEPETMIERLLDLFR